MANTKRSFQLHSQKKKPCSSKPITANSVGTLSLSKKLKKLGKDELEVVDICVDGLLVGGTVYGELHVDRDQRDFEKEALEEIRDMAIYLAARLIQLRRKA